MDYIIEDLETGELEGIPILLKEHFANEEPNYTSISSVLHACGKCAELPNLLKFHYHVIGEILNACCVQLSHLDDVPSKVALTKTLLSICVTIIRKEQFSNVLIVVGHLLKMEIIMIFKELNRSGGLSSSFKRIYALLWNLSIRTTIPNETFQLQSASLKFLHLVDRQITTFADKMRNAAFAYLQELPESLSIILDLYDYFLAEIVNSCSVQNNQHLEEFLIAFKLLHHLSEFYKKFGPTSCSNHTVFIKRLQLLKKTCKLQMEDPNRTFLALCCDIASLAFCELKEEMMRDAGERISSLCSFLKTHVMESYYPILTVVLTYYLERTTECCFLVEKPKFAFASLLQYLGPLFVMLLKYLLSNHEDEVESPEGIKNSIIVISMLATLLAIHDEEGIGTQDWRFYVKHLERQKKKFLGTEKVQDIYAVGVAAVKSYNNGIIAFNLRHFHAAFYLLGISCVFLKVWIRNMDPQKATLKKHTLVSASIVFMKVCFQLEYYEDVLDILVECLQRNEADDDETLKTYAKFKMQLAMSNENDVKNLSVMKYLQENDIKLKEERLQLLLIIECQCYISHQNTPTSLVLDALEALFDCSEKWKESGSSFLRSYCYALVEISRILFERDVAFKSMSPVEACQLFVQKISDLLSSLCESDELLVENEATVVKFYLSMCQFWLFMISRRATIDSLKDSQTAEPLKSRTEQVSKGNHGDEEVEEMENDDVQFLGHAGYSYRINSKLDLLMPLYKACDIWCDTFLVPFGTGNISSVAEKHFFCSVLKTAAQYFGLSKQYKNQVKCLQILAVVGNLEDQVHALIQQARIQLTLTHSSSSLIPKIEEMILSETKLKSSLQIDLLLLKSLECYYTGQYNLGLVHLNEVFVVVKEQANTPLSVYHKTQAYITASYFAGVSVEGATERRKYLEYPPLPYVLHALKYCLTLGNTCVDESVEGNLWYKPAFTELLLSTYAAWALALNEAGQPNEARKAAALMYQTAERTCLASWMAQALVISSQILYTCNLLNDSFACASDAIAIMTANSIDPSTVYIASTCSSSDNVEVVANDSADSFILQSPKPCPSIALLKALEREESSPMYELENTVTLPEFVIHSTSCTCSVCSSVAVLPQYLKALLLQILSQSQRQKTISVLVELHNYQVGLQKKHERNMGSIAELLGIALTQESSSTLHNPVLRLFCEICLELSEIFSSTDVVSASRYISMALVYFKDFSHLASPQLYARLLYQRVMLSLVKHQPDGGRPFWTKLLSGTWIRKAEVMEDTASNKSIPSIMVSRASLEGSPSPQTLPRSLKKNFANAPVKKFFKSTPMKQYYESLNVPKITVYDDLEHDDLLEETARIDDKDRPISSKSTMVTSARKVKAGKARSQSTSTQAAAGKSSVRKKPRSASACSESHIAVAEKPQGRDFQIYCSPPETSKECHCLPEETPLCPRSEDAFNEMDLENSRFCSIENLVEIGEPSAKPMKDVVYDPSELRELRDLLKEAMELVYHNPPYPLYAKLCLMSAALGLEESQPRGKEENAYFLCEATAVALRHRIVSELAIHLEKLKKNRLDYEGPSKEMISVKLQLTKFGIRAHSDWDLNSILENIPSGWRIIQVSALPRFPLDKAGVPPLLISRYEKGSAPITVFIDENSLDMEFARGCLKSFARIIRECNLSMNKQDKKAFWTLRRALDNDLQFLKILLQSGYQSVPDLRMKAFEISLYSCVLKDLVESMEHCWLGLWKGIFLGSPKDKKDKLRLSKMFEEVMKFCSKHKLMPLDTELVQVLLQSVGYLNNEQLSEAITSLWNIMPSDQRHSAIFKMINSFGMVSKAWQLNPVLLVLDKEVQELPWESMPIIRDREATRVPSLLLLSAQLASYNMDSSCIYKTGVDPNETYYIVDPENNLEKTNQRFKDLFKRQEGWEGVCGNPPDQLDVKKALAEKDMFVYLGHGCGRKYIHGIKLNHICKPVFLLMGCSSGKLQALGENAEPTGIAYDYWLNGSPCVIGNLWNVTDGDIDKFTIATLSKWLPTWEKDGSTNIHTKITEAISKARSICRLPYLVGAAPVIYGLPIKCLGLQV